MAHLWSGRFAGDPDAEVFAFGSSFRVDRRLFEDDVRGSRAWAAALARAGVLSAADAAAIDARPRADSPQGTGRSRLRHARSRRRGRARFRRARAGRARRRRRPAAAHRAVAQRAGLRRFPALPEAAHPRDPGRHRAHLARVRRAGRSRGRRDDAVVHAPAPRAAGARRALLAVARAALRRDVDRLAAVLHEADELPLGSGAIAGTSYRDRRGRPGRRARLLPHRAQQHRRQRRSRLRRVVPPRGLARRWST